MLNTPLAHALKVALLLVGSGSCALIYQTTWFREFRLVFGASTAASAAVLAIFMGGLGFGGLVLGRRADAHKRPLLLYARLEAMIAVTVAVTPGLLWLSRQAYFLLGGTEVMGDFLGTGVRLLLTTLVLGASTFLMGGTLPAATRAVQTSSDTGRRYLALLYGSNTFGAVLGVFLSTFFMLEVLGNRQTLWSAALVNLLVAVLARRMALSADEVAVEAPAPAAGDPAVADAVGTDTSALPPAAFILGASGVAGFAFFLMELVWYRMLGPLLGGTTFTFGIILAVALFGVGVGGLLYALFGGDKTPSLGAFALVSTLEAFFLILPFVIGDDIAILALLLRPLGLVGFGGFVAGWCVVAAVVIFPGALISGIQFPMLIALLGKGRAGIGRQLGAAYAWNTVGAILGSLAGGFGLLPMLGALGSWRLAVALLVGLGCASLVLSFRLSQRSPTRIAAAVAAIVTVFAMTVAGPTAVWRHSPIGVGRVDPGMRSINKLKAWMNRQRSKITWEVDGVESSVALNTSNSISFVVGGKSDGNARGDAGTQVMIGLIAALRHAEPKTSLVIGLGTGSSAGWLGVVPGMDRVDVVELEPAIEHVADVCSPVNQDVLNNPKVHITYGDARELLLTTRKTYDLIVSEPSNPYRAGIASLFTSDYYEAAAGRLGKGGIFAQWLQAYGVDNQTVRTVYATLGSVFPYVETWQTQAGDLLLISSLEPLPVNLGELRQRLTQPPYRRAFLDVWRIDSIEGVLGHYVAGPQLAQQIAEGERGFYNTDDRAVLEFGFGRSAATDRFQDGVFREVGQRRYLPPALMEDPTIDWPQVRANSMALAVVSGQMPPRMWADQDGFLHLYATYLRYVEQEFAGALEAWKLLEREPKSILELEMVAELYAEEGDEQAMVYIEALREKVPITAQALEARLRLRQEAYEEAATLTLEALRAYQHNPWPNLEVMLRTIVSSHQLAAHNPAFAREVYDLLKVPFSALMHERARHLLRHRLLEFIGFYENCLDTLGDLEPSPPWEQRTLEHRVQCYSHHNDPRLEGAQADLDAFMHAEPQPFFVDVLPSAP